LERRLRGRFARSFCQVVLGGSGDNPLDLLHNSNKPSNAIRPGGLGGTPIKKNHPKRRKLRFYPPCISYPRPLVINISRRSSLEEINHVKSIGQKYRSNGALGNFDGSPNPRTHRAVYTETIILAEENSCSTKADIASIERISIAIFARFG
jgi:hypothetical protein